MGKLYFEKIVACLLSGMIMLTALGGYSTANAETNVSYGELTQDGQANATIYLGEDAGKIVSFAAKELQETIRDISGAVLPVFKGGEGNTGITASMVQNDVLVSKVGWHSFQVALSNNTQDDRLVKIAKASPAAIPAVVQGSEGHEAGQVSIPAGESVIVSGCFYIGYTLDSGEHVLDFSITAEGLDTIPNISLKLMLNCNIIPDPGFENMGDWIYETTGGSGISEEVYHTGKRSLHYTAVPTGNERFFYNQRFSLVAGHIYEVSFWAKANTDHTILPTVFHYKKDGSGLDPMSQTVITVSGNETWQKYTGYITVPSSGEYDNSGIYLYMLKSDGNIDIYFDDIAFVDRGTELPTLPEPARNMIPDSSFEQNGAWAGGEVSTGAAITGIHSFHYTRSSGESFFYNERLILKPGAEYELTFWAMSEKGITFAPLAFHYYEDGSDELSRYDWIYTSGGNEWKEYKGTVTIPDKEDYSNSALYYYIYTNDEHTDIYFDDISLIEVSDGEGNTEDPGEPAEELPEIPWPVYAPMGEGTMKIFLTTDVENPEIKDLYRVKTGKEIDYLTGSDGYAVLLDQNNIYIVGWEEKGVLNGVYDFLEKNTGILWTRATELGTVYEAQSTITIKEVNYTKKSPFHYRGNLPIGALLIPGYDFSTELMMARNQQNNSGISVDYLGIEGFGVGHNLFKWLPERYYETNPEWFSTDMTGKHLRPDWSTQINFYDYGSIPIIAANMRAYLNSTGSQYVFFGQNDTMGITVYPEMTQNFTTEEGVVVRPEDADYNSTVYFTYVNKLAKELEKTNPEASLMSYAYAFTEAVPRISKEAFSKNISIMFAPIYADDHSLVNNEMTNARTKNNLEGWSQLCDNIIYYAYYTCFQSEIYERPIAEKVQQDLQYFVELGIEGIAPENWVDGGGHKGWAINAMQFWLAGKLYWDPHADLEALKEEFCRKVYGNAAPYMLEYHQLIKQGWDAFPEATVKFGTGGDIYIGKFVIEAGIAEGAQKQLDLAYTAAAKATQKQRINLIKTVFQEQVAKYSGQTESERAYAHQSPVDKDVLISDTSLDFSQGPWSDIVPLTIFKNPYENKEVIPLSTEVRMMYDKDNLYVAYQLYDNEMEKLNIPGVDATGTWWNGSEEDTLETYITGSYDTNPNDYAAYFSDAGGSRFRYKPGPVFDNDPPEWETYTRKFNDRWVQVVVIPFTSMGSGITSENASLAGTFVRYYNEGVSLSNNYGWLGSDVWNPAYFGKITMVEAEPVLSMVKIAGSNTFEKGKTLQLSVSGTMSDDEAADFTNAMIEWSIDKENVATIDQQSGVITAVEAGTATVTVEVIMGSVKVSDTFDITVTSPTPPTSPPTSPSTPTPVPTPTPTPAPAPKFNDLAAAGWAAEAIGALAGKGIVSGVGNNNFAPDKNVARADFILMLVKALELEMEGLESIESFKDVPESAYYAKAVETAKQLGIVSGIGNDNFGPMREITRQDMMLILAKALEVKGRLAISADLTALNSFEDASQVAGYAKTALSTLIEGGFVKGTGNNKIAPTAKATRAQAAVLLYKFIQ